MSTTYGEVTGIIGRGGKLSVDDTDVNGILSVDFSGEKTGTLDNSTMSNPDDINTFQAGTTDPGSVQVKLDYAPGDTTQQALFDAQDSTLHSFVFVYRGRVWQKEFSAIVESVTENNSDTKLAEVTVTLKVSGAIVGSVPTGS